MSPSQFHPKKEITSTTNKNTNGFLPPPLKINKESHFIKKSSPPSYSSSQLSSVSSSLSISSSVVNSTMTQPMSTSSYKSQQQQQQRHPVIIYTHSPKAIHTEPKGFMSLVQKLTGLSRSDQEEEEDVDNPPLQQPAKQESGGSIGTGIGDKENDRESLRNEENEASSAITEENNYSSSIGENQVNSCFMAGERPRLEPPLNPYATMLPPSSAEFVYSNQPLLNYSDSLFFSHNMRTSIPSSEGMTDRIP